MYCYITKICFLGQTVVLTLQINTRIVFENMTFYLHIIDGYEDVINIGTPFLELGENFGCWNKKFVDIEKIKSKSSDSVGRIQYTIKSLLNTDPIRDKL